MIWRLFGLGVGDVCHGFLLMMVVTLIIGIKDVLAQSSTLAGPSWTDKDENAVFTCTASGGTLRRVEWRNSSLGQTSDITLADIIIRYEVSSGTVPIDRDPSHYDFDGSADGHPLTVKSVSLDDDATYWCRVNIQGHGDIDKPKEMRVRVKPSAISLKDLVTGTTYNSGGNAMVIAGLNRFMCIVPGVRPEADFAWTLDSISQTDSIETNTPTAADPRLFNCSSALNFTLSSDNTTSPTLTCSAHNRQDGTTAPEQTLTITLQRVQDPCQPNPCNEGTCTPTSTLDGYRCDCPESTELPDCNPVVAPQSCPGWCIGVIVGCCGGVVVIAIGGGVVYVVSRKKKPDHDNYPELDKNGKGGCRDVEFRHIEKT